MANKPAVTLTLAGDEKALVDSFARSAKAGGDMANKIDAASRQVQQAGRRIDGVAEHADRAGRATQQMADRFKDAGAQMVVTAAAVGVAVVSAFADSFAQARVGGLLAAQLGGGVERAAELGALTGRIYAEGFGASVDEVGAAIRGVLGANLVNEDAAAADVERVTKLLITVGQTMEAEAGEVSRAVSQLLRTGMVQSAEQAFDLLVRAQQQGLNKSEDLLETLNEYATQYRKLGLDGPTALGLISQAIQGGARDSDIAADAIKEFSLQAIDIGKARPGFEALGLSAEKMVRQIAGGGPAALAGLDLVLDRIRALRDPVARNTAATALFGTKWEDLGAALNAMDVTTAVDSLGRVSGATEQAGAAIAATRDPVDELQRVMSSSLAPVLQAVLPSLEAMGRFVAQNAGLLGPLAVAIGVVAAAQWLWNAAVAANPIVLVIGLIAALVVAFVHLWRTSDGFRNFFIDMWRGIRDFVVGVINAIPGAFRSMVNGIVTGLNWLVDKINWVVGQINSGVVAWLPGVPNIPSIPRIPRMHTGGTVPGPPGTERLILAKAGEHVSAPGQGGGGMLQVTGSGALFEVIQAAISDGSIVLVGRR